MPKQPDLPIHDRRDPERETSAPILSIFYCPQSEGRRSVRHRQRPWVRSHKFAPSVSDPARMAVADPEVANQAPGSGAAAVDRSPDAMDRWMAVEAAADWVWELDPVRRPMASHATMRGQSRAPRTAPREPKDLPPRTMPECARERLAQVDRRRVQRLWGREDRG